MKYVHTVPRVQVNDLKTMKADRTILELLSSQLDCFRKCVCIMDGIVILNLVSLSC